MDFKLGDLVQLKSGGPVMTVSEVTGNSVMCIWFEKTKSFQRAFPTVTLEKYEGYGAV